MTRHEYNHIIDVFNERNAILNGLRDAVQRLEQASEFQFKRTAQMQAELDETRNAESRLQSQIAQWQEKMMMGRELAANEPSGVTSGQM